MTEQTFLFTLSLSYEQDRTLITRCSDNNTKALKLIKGKSGHKSFQNGIYRYLSYI